MGKNKGKVVTSKKEKLIVISKPDDPSRKFMSKKDALDANNKSREREAKLDNYKTRLEAEDAAPSAPPALEAPPEVEAPKEPKKTGRPKKTKE